MHVIITFLCWNVAIATDLLALCSVLVTTTHGICLLVVTLHKGDEGLVMEILVHLPLVSLVPHQASLLDAYQTLQDNLDHCMPILEGHVTDTFHLLCILAMQVLSLGILVLHVVGLFSDFLTSSSVFMDLLNVSKGCPQVFLHSGIAAEDG